MFENIDKRFEYLKSLLEKHGTSTDLVEKAYAKAKDLHFYQKRNDGTPYLVHPVEVAIILAELEFDQDVICGALLHDTIEDCGYTVQQMQEDFNTNIAEMVDSVSAIDKTKYIYNENNIFEDPEFVKSSAEEQTFKKLIAIGKKNPCGFCIKFADRLHNLSTIATFEYPKQLEKVRETEKWILPIAKALKSHFFYNQIQNQCFKIIHRNDGQNFIEQYNIYHQSTKAYMNNFLILLKEMFANDFINDIKTEALPEKIVFDNIKKLYRNIHIKDVSQCQILKSPTFCISFVCEDGMQKIVIDKILSKSNSLDSIYKVFDAKIDEFSSLPTFFLQDKFQNIYQVFVLSKQDYRLLRTGTLDGQNNELIDEENVNDLDIDMIKVKTRSGETKYISKNSTVLDFAFKIHNDIGFAFNYALVNGSKTKLPPYTKLHENDKVEIICDTLANGEMKNNAKLKWLAYVNSEFAKKVLIKYFEHKYSKK
mgnify:FL=1